MVVTREARSTIKEPRPKNWRDLLIAESFTNSCLARDPTDTQVKHHTENVEKTAYKNSFNPTELHSSLSLRRNKFLHLGTDRLGRTLNQFITLKLKRKLKERLIRYLEVLNFCQFLRALILSMNQLSHRRTHSAALYIDRISIEVDDWRMFNSLHVTPAFHIDSSVVVTGIASPSLVGIADGEMHLNLKELEAPAANLWCKKQSNMNSRLWPSWDQQVTPENQMTSPPPHGIRIYSHYYQWWPISVILRRDYREELP